MKQKRIWSTVGLLGNLACLSGTVGLSIVELRRNNLEMVDLYKKVESADLAGAQVYDRLGELQSYVSTHMNATPPKIGSNPSVQLKYTYERAKKSEADRQTAERDRIHSEAISYCERLLGSRASIYDQTQCVMNRDASQAVVENVIVADLYKYDFVSPKWTPDLAGWSIVVSAVLGLLFVLQLLSRIISRMIIKK